jgi:TPR repeat protein
MAVWIVVFGSMITTSFIARDVSAAGAHPGSSLAFWDQACAADKYNACRTYLQTLQLSCTNDRRAASCDKAGTLLLEGRHVPRDEATAAKRFSAECELGASAGCGRLASILSSAGPDRLQRDCNDGDGSSCFVLARASLLGLGLRRDPERARGLFHDACSNRWAAGCGQLGEVYAFGQGASVDTRSAIDYFERACSGDFAPSCFNAAIIYRQGLAGSVNPVRAAQRMRAACDLGFELACRSM